MRVLRLRGPGSPGQGADGRTWDAGLSVGGGGSVGEEMHLGQGCRTVLAGRGL